MCAYMHIYIHIYIYTLHVYTCAHMHIHTHKYTHHIPHPPRSAYTYTWAHLHKHTHTCAFIHRITHVCLHTHTRTHTWTFTRTKGLIRWRMPVPLCLISSSAPVLRGYPSTPSNFSGTFLKSWCVSVVYKRTCCFNNRELLFYHSFLPFNFFLSFFFVLIPPWLQDRSHFYIQSPEMPTIASTVE